MCKLWSIPVMVLILIGSLTDGDCLQILACIASMLSMSHSSRGEVRRMQFEFLTALQYQQHTAVPTFTSFVITARCPPLWLGIGLNCCNDGFFYSPERLVIGAEGALALLEGSSVMQNPWKVDLFGSPRLNVTRGNLTDCHGSWRFSEQSYFYELSVWMYGFLLYVKSSSVAAILVSYHAVD